MSDDPAAPALAVVIPAGPADDIADTVHSVVHFSRPRAVVVVDDTNRRTTLQLERAASGVHVLSTTSPNVGVRGRLWRNVAAGIRWAVRNVEFDVLLRMDADAVMIGPGIAALAAERFAQDPSVGLLGSFRTGMDGGTRDWSWAAATLARECGVLGLRRPAVRRTLRRLRAQAATNGYLPGAHPLGAACLCTAALASDLERAGFLDLHELGGSQLGDDHLLGLLAMAAGHRIGDFAGPDDPLALDWKGLPASPEELLARRKLIAHSVRRWGPLGEREIRSYFARARSASSTFPKGPKPR